METYIVIFWFVVISCASGLFAIRTRLRSGALGWAVLYFAILLVAVIGWVGRKNGIIYAGLGMWLVLVLLPALLSRVYQRYFFEQRYARALRLARIISWLHPADGWREQVEIVGALELAQQGNLTVATETLRRFQGTKGLPGLASVINLYKITNQWEELLLWQGQHALQLKRYPQFLPLLLRAYGETGDLRGMVDLYERNKQLIARLVPATSRDSCRLTLFAFCGQRRLVEGLLAGNMAVLPEAVRQFWLATADLASGATESAQRQLEHLLPVVDPAMRLAVERRLCRLPVRLEPLDAPAQWVIDEATREQGQDDRFGARRSLFSSQARGTQLLILLNVLVFMAEVLLGGATNGETLYQLGALFGPAVRAGQWWRLVASLFLHWGALHLTMNMVGLWVLGPFTEFALGFRRYMAIYLLAGIGSMGTVMAMASGANGDQLTVGASECIMGLVGATAGLMLRGWLREKASIAKRRLVAMFAIVVLQTFFDSLVPQVSMTAHISGALIGFLGTVMVRDRLKVGMGGVRQHKTFEYVA